MKMYKIFVYMITYIHDSQTRLLFALDNIKLVYHLSSYPFFIRVLTRTLCNPNYVNIQKLQKNLDFKFYSLEIKHQTNNYSVLLLWMQTTVLRRQTTRETSQGLSGLDHHQSWVVFACHIELCSRSVALQLHDEIAGLFCFEPHVAQLWPHMFV
jgi:hypothetical protein